MASDVGMPLEDRLRLAWAGLFNHGIFDASVLTSMTLEPADWIPTAATDCMKHVWYNPKFFEDMTSACIRTVLAHEGRHKVFMHGLRRGDRNPKLWNIAGDFIINKSLHDEKHDFSHWKPLGVADYIQLINGQVPATLKDPKAQTVCLDLGLGVNETTESIYDRLLQAAQQAAAKMGQESQGVGQEGEGTGNPDEEGGETGRAIKRISLSGDVDYEKAKEAKGELTDEQAERDVTASIVAAAHAAKAVGKLPASVQRLVQDFLAPRVNWRSVLRHFMMSAWGAPTVSGDYSYRRPSRRPIGGGIILPSFRKQPAAPIVISVDTSGSIGQKELDQFAGEIKAIIRDVRPSRTVVLYHDAEVQDSHEFGPDDMVVLKPKGGGGTDFNPVFEWIEEQRINPAAVVMLTDLYGPYPSAPPKWPVLWACTSNATCPWGKVLELKI